MKNTLKILVVTLLTSLCLSFIALGNEGRDIVTVGNDFNHEYSAAYRYVYNDNSFAKNEWKYCVNEWYYFDDDGMSKRSTWFQDTSGKWYYFDEWSRMLHDTTTPDGYTVGSDGAWIKDGQVVVETDTSTTEATQQAN